MPRPYPMEFRRDVVAVARRGEAPLKQVAADFGIAESCLRNWLRDADVEDGNRPGVTRSESTELREANRRIRLLEQENEVLRRAAAYLSQANLPKRLYPLVSELAVDGVPVAVTCRVLKLARQPYYRWLAAPVTSRELEQAHLANTLFDAHLDDPEFGHRLLADEAARAGMVACDRTVWRICSSNGWWSVFGKKRSRGGKKAGPPAHDDLVLRQFRADGPNRLWLWDITEHPTAEGKIYLCAIKDVFSNRIVGYSISDRMTSQIAVNALVSAVQRRRDVAGCVVHSDRGSQFRSRKVARVLAHHDLVGSMGQVASAGDNAAMESFFSLLQKNVLNRRRWATRQDLRIAIITWIERTYHRRRRQQRLGRLTPIEFETIMNTQVALAA
ncbi:IS3 family transposase [Cellulomonas sp. NTE-D12]|uniref:IS3 family transposase n=1 Tax=Cellulomonas sp. NTE-D12 TaxID=2962632 RepID=UPI003081836B